MELKSQKKRFCCRASLFALLFAVIALLAGCNDTLKALSGGSAGQQQTVVSDSLSEDQTCSSKEEVALYLHLYGHLPDNYITKQEAQKLGWESSKGNLWDVAPGKSIGGSKFGNYEGLLPESDSRQYYECDIDYNGGFRNEKRLVYSNDGLIYYTGDHYESFELLYGEEP